MSFLNFDIEKALDENGFSPCTLDIGPALNKEIRLEYLELEMFHTLVVTKLPDGTVWLDFQSSKYAPSKSMMEFMAYCTDLYGLDNKGQGLPSERDVSLLKEGNFGRYWDNVKILQVKFQNQLALSIVMRIILDNPDMSNFTKNLAKGFVRSAVNQVGRDGGRVISNQIYNNRNYVPVSPINANGYVIDGYSQNGDFALKGNETIVTKPFSSGRIFWLIILSLLLFPIGTIGVLIYGIVKLFDKTAKVQWTETKPQFVPDRRYKSGSRFVGNVEVKHKRTIEALPMYANINKKNGITAISISVAVAILMAIGLIFF